MSDFLFILIVFSIVVAGVLVSIFYIKRETAALKKNDQEKLPLGMIKQDIENLRRKFENGYSQMSHELGKVQEIGRNIKEFQDFLRSPKLRGNIGEQVLHDLLQQCLPKQNFSLQYQFREGQIVDAVIKTNQGLVPIDSKFPMESFKRMVEQDSSSKEAFRKEFQRDIKKHINDIARKYILPQEGTVDFALMYIPSEPIYYEIAVQEPELSDYGQEKKVYFVSPNSFYYFLKIILVGLEGAKIEQGAKRILEGMKAVQQEAINFDNELSVLSAHIEHAKVASDRTRSRFDRLAEKIERLGELEAPDEGKKLE